MYCHYKYDTRINLLCLLELLIFALEMNKGGHTIFFCPLIANPQNLRVIPYHKSANFFSGVGCKVQISKIFVINVQPQSVNL
jgi:hypothetical protein